MLKLFGGGNSDHPLADVKSARKVLDEISASDPFKALEELGHWHESARTAEGFRPEYRAQLALLIDDAAQAHVRKLQRDYIATPRPSKFQENRLWNAIHGYWQQSALAFASSIDQYATGQKGADALKESLPLLAVRALRALAAQMRWQHVRYGPVDEALWSIVARICALAESRKFARISAAVYPGVAGESSPEQEFLRAVMFAASSPDGLLPIEIELAERLIAHFSASFALLSEAQPGALCWIDLAASRPPLRLVQPPPRAPTQRFIAAGKAAQELEQLMRTIKSANAVPSGIALGGNYEPAEVLDVLSHLALYWSPKPPERKAPRHKVKSRLTVTHGFDGVLAALDPSAAGADGVESWVVENVSAGGFGASIPQMRGEWLGIGGLLGLQPEGGDNWVIGVIRRLQRATPQQGNVGIETLARVAAPVNLRFQDGTGSETGVLLNPSDAAVEAQLLLRAGAFMPGRNLELARGGKLYLLMPANVTERGDDYEVVRCRQMIREAGE